MAHKIHGKSATDVGSDLDVDDALGTLFVFGGVVTDDGTHVDEGVTAADLNTDYVEALDFGNDVGVDVHILDKAAHVVTDDGAQIEVGVFDIEPTLALGRDARTVDIDTLHRTEVATDDQTGAD